MATPEEERKKWSFSQSSEYFEDMKHKFLPIFNEELTTLVPEWKFLQGRPHVSAEWHTYNVLYLIWNDKKL